MSNTNTVAFPRMFPGSKVVEVLDADSVRVDLDLGFGIHWEVLCRLHGVAGREKSDPGGPEARTHLMEMLPVASLVDVLSVKWDKYSGRVQAVLFVTATHIDAGAQMIADGFAAPWDGKGVQPKPPWPIPPKPGPPASSWVEVAQRQWEPRRQWEPDGG